LIASFGNSGRFVVTQPKSMSCPMQPLFLVSIPFSGEERIHARIQVRTRHAGLNKTEGKTSRFHHRIKSSNRARIRWRGKIGALTLDRVTIAAGQCQSNVRAVF